MSTATDNNRQQVYATLVQALSESEFGLLNYLQATESLVRASKQKMDPLRTTFGDERHWNDFQRTVGKNLSAVAGLQMLILKKTRLLGDFARGPRMPISFVDFLNQEHPEFSRCVMSIDQMLSKNLIARRHTASAVRSIYKYASDKAEVRRAILGQQSTTPWLSTDSGMGVSGNAKLLDPPAEPSKPRLNSKRKAIPPSAPKD